MFFFAEKLFDSNCFSEHMTCSFDTSAIFVSPETRNILAQTAKVWKVSFLLEKCPSESSTGQLECLPDETGVWLQIEISSEEPWKYTKFYLLPKNFFLKKFYWSRRFQFWHPCRKHLPTSGTSQFRISKQSQNYVFFFEEKTFCLKVFPWTNGMLFWHIS